MQASLIASRSTSSSMVVVATLARPRVLSPRFLSVLSEECRSTPAGLNSCHPKSIINPLDGGPAFLLSQRASASPIGPTGSLSASRRHYHILTPYVGEGVIPSMREVNLETTPLRSHFSSKTPQSRPPQHPKNANKAPSTSYRPPTREEYKTVTRSRSIATVGIEDAISFAPIPQPTVRRPPPLTTPEKNSSSAPFHHFSQLGPTRSHAGSRSLSVTARPLAGSPQSTSRAPRTHEHTPPSKSLQNEQQPKQPRQPRLNELPDGVESIMAAVRASGDAKAAPESAADGVVSGLKHVAQSAASGAKAAASRAKAIVEESVSDTSKPVTERVTNLTQNAVQAAVQASKDSLGWIATHSLDAAESLVAAGKDRMGRAVEVGKDNVNIAAAIGKKGAHDLAAAGKEKAENIAESVQEVASAGKNKAAEAGKQVVDNIKQVASTSKDKAAGAGKQVVDNIKQVAAAGKEKAENMVDKVQEVAAAGKDKAAEAGKQVVDNIKQVTETGSDKAEQVVGNMKQAASAGKDKAAEAGKQVVDNVKLAASTGKEKAENMAAKVQETAVAGKDKAAEAGKQVADNLKQAAATGKNKAEKLYEGKKNEAVEATADTAQSAIDSLEDKVTSAADSAKAKSERASDSVQSIRGMRSPGAGGLSTAVEQEDIWSSEGGDDSIDPHSRHSGSASMRASNPLERAADRAEASLHAVRMASENAEQKAQWARDAIEDARRANEMFAAAMQEVEREAERAGIDFNESQARVAQQQAAATAVKSSFVQLSRGAMGSAAQWAKEAPADAKVTAGAFSVAEMREIDDVAHNVPPSQKDSFIGMPQHHR